MSALEISHVYDRVLAEAVERAYEAGYQRGYSAGKLDGELADIKKESVITPLSYRPPQNLRA